MGIRRYFNYFVEFSDFVRFVRRGIQNVITFRTKTITGRIRVISESVVSIVMHNDTNFDTYGNMRFHLYMLSLYNHR